MFIIVLCILAFLNTNNTTVRKNAVEYTYGDLIEKIENNEISEITVEKSSEANDYGMITAVTNTGETFKTSIVGFSSFMDYINGKIVEGSKIKTEILEMPKVSVLSSILPSLILMVLAIIIFSFMFQRMQGGGGKMMNFGKSRAKVTVDDKNRVTFGDVAGLDEEKAELVELVDFLKEPKKFIDLGARIPKGVLLVGPPGTGKTLLAKAVAGEAKVPFFSISGSDFVEMFVGVGASRVRDLFDQAKKNSPCIVFIDEIDAVGRRRGAGLGGGHDEREQTLNQLLVEMDGFGVNEGVIVVAATNRADILDPAILRPGRFDRQVYVGRPDVKGREAILKVHAKGKPFAKEVDLSVVAKTTSGFTGADLENLLNEAALLSARNGKKEIDMEEIQKAFVKVGIGTEKKSRVINEKEKKITAYHETGHAILFEILSELDPVHSISIIPTGMAGGYTMPLPGEDKMYITKKTMEQEIVSFLGGRAAEQIIFKDVTTGASNDIERATGIARSMVMKYGMSDVLGPVLFGDDGGEVFIGKEIAHSRNYGEDVAGTIDKEVKRIMDTSYNEAIRLLNENIDVLHATAKILVEKEKITGEDFRKIMENPTEALEEIEASEKVGLEKNSGENDEVSNETENKKAIDIVIEDSKEETKNENCEKTEE
ncbi:MAG: ATP-dependent metallopeptidase FtsH/Yme1/Tma family protein [Firmicutes bacterium]|nr:ATP-dependent metallopeptidase FtsH/Yme1/Tma family protein [Bacillota bacterium]